MQGFISRMVDPTSVLIASRTPLPKSTPSPLPPLRTPARTFTHEELFAAADVILFTPRGPIEPWPITAALASGRPIVSTVTPGQCELLEDRHTCLMATAPTPRLLARRLLDLHNDPTLAWQLADRARAESYDLHPLSKQRHAWSTLLSQPDTAAALPATAVQGA
jgi:glycosyltransferase involved in cell wall biosynthesis